MEDDDHNMKEGSKRKTSEQLLDEVRLAREERQKYAEILKDEPDIEADEENSKKSG